MMKRLNKAGLRQGFRYYLLSTLALALIFFSYIFHGASTDVMTLAGWFYFAASCLTHAAILRACEAGDANAYTAAVDAHYEPLMAIIEGR